MMIEITPLDPLFFRDGKPFAMSEETWADIIFPPNPSTIYGALRTTYFSKNFEDFPKANTNEDPTKDLHIKNIFLKVRGKDGIVDYVFHTPYDIVSEKGEGDDNSLLKLNLVPLSKTKAVADFPLEYILEVPKNKVGKRLDGKFLGKDEFSQYIREDKIPYVSTKALYSLNIFTVQEPKIGIRRDNATHSSKEGHLYRVNMVRFSGKVFENEKACTLSILIDFDFGDGKNEKFPKRGVMKLGGEGKVAKYEVLQNTKEMEDVFSFKPSLNGKKTYFKLYLHTPAVFSGGWIPDIVRVEQNNKYIGEVKKGNKKVRFKLIGFVSGKPLYIGGFEMRAKRNDHFVVYPKPMKKAVPAGSVYFFEVLEGEDLSPLLENYNGKSICTSEQYKKEGYGIVYVGKVEI